MARKTDRRAARRPAPEAQQPVLRLEPPPAQLDVRTATPRVEQQPPRGAAWVDFYL